MISNDIISRSIFRDILNALCIYNNNSNTSTMSFHSLLLLPVKMQVVQWIMCHKDLFRLLLLEKYIL